MVNDSRKNITFNTDIFGQSSTWPTITKKFTTKTKANQCKSILKNNNGSI